MATEVKNYFSPPVNFKTINFLKEEEVTSLQKQQMEIRDQLSISAFIAQLDLMILHKLNEGGYEKEHILVPGLEFRNEATICSRREEVIEEYSQRGIAMEFVLAPIPQAGEKVTYFRVGVNIDVSYYIKFKLKKTDFPVLIDSSQPDCNIYHDGNHFYSQSK